MKKLFLFSVLVLIFGSCATTKVQKKSAELYTPKFDFVPPTEAEKTAEKITFLLVGAKYSEDNSWTRQFPFNSFPENMSSDLQEILTARGYTIRGPFTQYDEISFPDKKGSDFILTPISDVKVEVYGLERKSTGHNILFPKLDKYVQQANIRISGRVTLAIRESLSNELMSSKSVDLPDTILSVRGENEYSYETFPARELVATDPGIENPLSHVLEVFYQKAMQTAWDHLNPEEMAILKNQAEEIKKKKVY